MADDSQAIIGFLTIYAVEDAVGSGNYIEIGELTNVTPPNESADDVERTHMKSPGGYKEFTPGLIDGGTSTFEINNIPGDVTDDFIAAWRLAKEVRSTRITYPNEATATFKAYVKGFAPKAFGPSGLIQAALTVRVAGQVVRG